MDQHKKTLTPAVLWLMAISSGLVVANNYYNQPLLTLIAKEFQVSDESVSKIPMLTQMGYALGLLIIVPLGDLLKRKKLIVIDFALILAAVLGMALSPSLSLLYVFSFLTGLTSVVPQLFIPMAASLSHPEKRTHSIGLVMSGLLVGILGSRILSGYVGNIWGWRSMFFIAAGIMVLLWIFIWWKLPEVHPQYKGSYKELMKSVFHYAKTEPALQAASFRGAFLFASFSAFWTSLVFHLEQAPFNAGSAVAGSFGFLGILGALMAAFTGKLAKTISYNKLTWILLAVFLGSWGVLWAGGNTYLGLIIGVVVLDVAMQALHIMNQSSIFSLHPHANNRLNTVYMTTYFVGGSTGTYLAGLAWQQWQWNGVLLVGIGFGIAAAFVHLLYRKLYTGQAPKELEEEALMA
ncbi:MFS transporter [Desertivirga arenae]|uniref:MFS transporter n=1 Tax=Desertivirga arenae TaxID=2810309 RepID=UPI001F613CE3|nr:MFS transporter [Pedobacter sp. SYSU D00823]